MRINDQDIARMAQELRDEDNYRLNVRRWSRHRRFQFPTWLAAIPAAVIVGFLLGIWTNGQTMTEMPKMAIVDTVYIKVPVSLDTAQSVAASLMSPPVSRARGSRPVGQPRATPTGLPMQSDQIRYDLLVKN